MIPELATTWYIDHGNPAVQDYAHDAVGDATDRIDQAIALFHRVRDGIRYDPYGISYDPEAFRASAVVEAPTNWCVPKSVLLTAAARHLGIPARLGFADVRNHLTSEKLSASMGTDLFAWHGYSELLLPDRAADDGSQRWFKLSSAFNIELCERFGVEGPRVRRHRRRPDASVRSGREPPHGVRRAAGQLRRSSPRPDARRLPGDVPRIVRRSGGRVGRSRRRHRIQRRRLSRHPAFGSGRGRARERLGGAVPILRVEMHLAEAHVLRRDLDALVGGDELERVFERQHTVRRQFDRLVR